MSTPIARVDEAKLDALAEASKRAEAKLDDAYAGDETHFLLNRISYTLDAKEAEIEELRKQLGLAPRVWS